MEDAAGAAGGNSIWVSTGSGAIVAHTLTDANADDAPTGLKLIDAVNGDISSVTADGAYDTIAIYEAAAVHGATVVIPPTITRAVSRRRPRSSRRDRTIRRVKRSMHQRPQTWSGRFCGAGLQAWRGPVQSSTARPSRRLK